MNEVSHVCFSDESNWNDGRFRSIGMVSLPADDLDFLEAELASFLRSADVSEFKWTAVNGGHIKSLAEKMCDFAIKYGLLSKLRIDVLIWDTEDKRHKVLRRDDEKNLNIMYFHLLRNVFRERWPDDAVWKLNPDENNVLDGKTLQECLDNAKTQVEFIAHTLFNERESFRLLCEYGQTEVQPVKSENHALLQLTDLFAGLAAFSHMQYSKYEEWKKLKGPLPLFPDEVGNVVDPSKFSNREKYRFDLLYNFHHKCMHRKLSVGLKEKRGLYTYIPDKPMNFWLYERQHAEDKAPIKAHKT